MNMMPIILVIIAGLIIGLIIFRFDTSSTKDLWDKTKILAEIIGILVAIYCGHIVSSAIKQRELNLKYVQLATDILKAEPTEEISDLRDWSIEVLEKYSKDVHPLSEKAVKNLKHFSLPSSRPRLNDVPDHDGIPDPDWVP